MKYKDNRIMHHNHVVIFEEGKIPRVVHNVDPGQYHPNSILVNPVLPRGVPPHRWKKVKNWIEVLPDTEVAPQKPIALAPAKPELQLKHYLLMGIASLALSVLLHLIMH